jgi:hypothetical protein
VYAVIFHDVAQNTPEWDLLRLGKPTSSKLAVIMAHFGKAFGDPARKYAVDIAVEQISGAKAEGGFRNEDMDRGHEDEPLARMLYEEETFATVANGGFFDHGTFGCSPDGLIGSDGVIEIKSAIPSIHYERISRKTFDSAYRWQVIGNMKFTGRAWLDFVSYCKTFPEGKRLFVVTLERDKFASEFQMIDDRLGEFQALIDEAKHTILSSNYFLRNAA